MKDFEKYLKREGLRPETIKTYMFSLKRFFKITGAEINQPITKDHLNKWKDYCLDHYSAKAQIPKYASIKRYVNYLIEELEILDEVFETKVRRILKLPRSAKLRRQGTNLDLMVLQPEEYQDIFAIAKQRNFMHYALFKTAFWCMLRRCEAIGLKIGDINPTARKVHIRPEIAKGGKAATINISQECLDIIKEYIDNHRDNPKRGFDDILFLRDGRSISKTKIYEICKEYSAITDIELHFHKWRHTGTTQYAKVEKDPKIVQDQARHDDINTTMKYIHYASQDFEKSYHEKFGEQEEITRTPKAKSNSEFTMIPTEQYKKLMKLLDNQ